MLGGWEFRDSYGQIRPARIFSTLSPNVVAVQNTTGADVIAYSVLGITGVLNTPTGSAGLDAFQTRPVFLGVTPTTASHSGKFVVTLKSIKNNAIGLGFIAGPCPVQVSIGSTSDRFADVNNGDVTKLLSGSSGSAQILYAPASTGTQWCWVRLENGC